MLAATAVEPGEGNGGDRRSDQWKKLTTEKPSARKFAEKSGISHPTVMSYLSIYDECAAIFTEYQPRDTR